MKQYFLFPLFILSMAAPFYIKMKGEDPMNAIVQKMQKWKDQYPQEKVFVQTDKGTYVAGETIWFKSWCTLDGQPSFLSRILYVDIINSNNGSVVEKKMLKLDSLSSSNGSIALMNTLTTGNYTIRAYTLWMQNFKEFIFQKPIYIYGKDFRKTAGKFKKQQISLQFFPEGGDLVAGVNNYLAFKATNENGLPVEVNGTIKSNTGVSIPFSTTHNGMGVIEFIPENLQQYTATIEQNSKPTAYNLPIAKTEGIAMHVNNNSLLRTIVILQRSETKKELYKEVYVFAQMNGKPVISGKLNLDEDQNSFPISKKELPAGIMHITVFSTEGKPLAERLVFVSNYATITPVINFDTLGLEKRQKNVWNFNIKDVNAASLSVLVADAALSEPSGYSDHIQSSVLLTSDIKGYVHHPGYYFEKKDTARLNRLDLVMLTNGWRRFKWKSLLQNDSIALKYPVESSIQIMGKVSKNEKGAIVKDGKVSFIIKAEDSTTILSEAKLTDKGEFMVNGLDYRKKATVSYLGTNNERSTIPVNVTLYPAYIDSLKQVTNSEAIDLDTINIVNTQTAISKYLLSNAMNLDTVGVGYLANVTVTAKKKNPIDSLNDEYATGPYTNVGSSINPEKYPQYQSVWQILQASVPGINVTGDPFNPNVYFNRYAGNDVFLNNSGTDPDGGATAQTAMPGTDGGIMYLLNELPVGKEIINTLMPSDVALIKVMKGPESFMLGANEGIVSFYTKKGMARRTALYDKDFNSTNRMGYDVIREFYHPDYTKYPNLNTSTPDNRITIYWNGKPKMDTNGKYYIRFHNTDQSKILKLIIQGIDKDGQLVYFEQLVK